MISIINHMAKSWLEYFGYACAQNTIFLCIILLVLHWQRDINAHLKYTIAALGLIKLLIPPFLPVFFGSDVPSAGIVVFNPIVFLQPGALAAPHLSVASIAFLFWSALLALYLILPIFFTLRLKRKIRDAFFLKKMSLDGYGFSLFQSAEISVPMSIGIRPDPHVHRP